MKDKFNRGELITAVVAFCKIKKRYRGDAQDLERYNINGGLRMLAKMAVKEMKGLDRRSRRMMKDAFGGAGFHDSGLTKSLKFYRIY